MEAFLKILDRRAQAAVEFRHPSWFDDEVYACLRAHGCTLCIADTEEFTCPDVSTTRFGYVRLRREAYSDKDLRKWVKTIKSQSWAECYVFFKHEDTGTGPRFADRFLKLAAV